MRTTQKSPAPEGASVARLTADLAEMREDRDRWRAQAERLVVALERLPRTAPDIQPTVSPVLKAPKTISDSDILHGFAAIGEHLGISEDAARGRVIKEGIPIVRKSRRIWIRRCDLNAWLAAQAAAAQEGR